MDNIDSHRSMTDKALSIITYFLVIGLTGAVVTLLHWAISSVTIYNGAQGFVNLILFMVGGLGWFGYMTMRFTGLLDAITVNKYVRLVSFLNGLYLIIIISIPEVIFTSLT
jgi:hypothetical protein